MGLGGIACTHAWIRALDAPLLVSDPLIIAPSSFYRVRYFAHAPPKPVVHCLFCPFLFSSAMAARDIIIIGIGNR